MIRFLEFYVCYYGKNSGDMLLNTSIYPIIASPPDLSFKLMAKYFDY